ncbi:MAG TPA: glycosyltransferase [Bacteroidales bacterium]|jgi:glycosyltransferase involved in cell wall biosynthesis|nr:glycosyltransferase [Bacteroidales bacterium]
MNDPLISICCITYNHEKFIAEAIEGFFMQKTNFNYEIIISDDYSTDNTLNIINKYISDPKNNGKIKCFHHPQNIGMIPNFIFALQHCTGKYIALCEGDDFWTDPFKLKKQVDFLENNHDFYAVFHNAIIVDKNSKRIKNFHNKEIDSEHNFESIIQGWFVPTASIVFRNDAEILQGMKELISKTEIISGDRLLLAFIGNQGKIKYFSDIMSAYRKHGGGISSCGNHLLIFKSNINFFKELRKYFYPKYYNTITNQILRWQGIYSVELYKNKKYSKYFIELFKTFLYIRTLNEFKAFIKLYLLQRNDKKDL